jgi:hypothetical protein
MTRSSCYITYLDEKFPNHLFASNTLEGNVANSGDRNPRILRK